MKKLIILLSLLPMLALAQGKRISQYPHSTNLAPTDWFIVEKGDGSTNESVAAGNMGPLLSLSTRKPFTIVHLPDFQVANDAGTEAAVNAYAPLAADWIMSNREPMNIVAVMWTGDLSLQKGTWATFMAWSNAFATVRANIPFIQTCGNHDSDTGAWPGSDYGLNTTNWDNIFTWNFYTNTAWWNSDCAFWTNVATLNMYVRTPISSNQSLSMIVLGPDPQIQHYNWASNLVTIHPNDIWVLGQHRWLANFEGTDRRFTVNDYYGVYATFDAQKAWNASVRYWPVPLLTFSGHFIFDGVSGSGPKQSGHSQDIGYYGNPVFQMFHNYQTTNSSVGYGYLFQAITVDPITGTVFSQQITNASLPAYAEKQNTFTGTIQSFGAGLSTRDRITIRSDELGTNGWMTPMLKFEAPTNRTSWTIWNNISDGNLHMTAGTNLTTLSNAQPITFTSSGIVWQTNTVSTTPTAAELGLGGFKIWNSNGIALWVSYCVSGSTVVSKQLAP